jgi:type IV secretory pathway protease TraF
MLPAYDPGDILLGWRWFRPRPGQVVVARLAGRPIIKRIVAITPAGLHLAGDNPGRSTDSRHFGPLPAGQLEAVILMRVLK